eukprot:1405950-Rhodomonas_salina.1
MPLFGGTNYWQKVSEVSTEGDKTEFTWTVGRVKKCSFGDSIKSSTIKSGGQLWKVVYFPKGFTVRLAEITFTREDDSQCRRQQTMANHGGPAD